MNRKYRICPSCRGTQYLRTSHRGKAGTWRCVVCGRVDDVGVHTPYPTANELILAATCERCGANLRVRKERDADDRVPYCPVHGRVFV